jgi:HSP20 family molecular chaperone IbpA
MNGPLETPDMLVVTVRVPTRDAAELEVSVRGGIISVSGPADFRHDVPLPSGADVDRLHAGLFRDVLELRAPRTDSAPDRAPRSVPVAPLF